MGFSSPVTFNSYILMFTDQKQQNNVNIASFEAALPKLKNVEIRVSSSLLNSSSLIISNSTTQVFHQKIHFNFFQILRQTF